MKLVKQDAELLKKCNAAIPIEKMKQAKYYAKKMRILKKSVSKLCFRGAGGI